MDKRILWACIAALGALLGFDLLTQLSGWKLDVPLHTSLGMVPLGSVLMTLAAMTLGGWIARRNFHWIALLLSAVMWIAVLAVLHFVPPPGAPTMTLAAIMKFNALAIVLSLAASWFGAWLGETLAERQGPPASA